MVEVEAMKEEAEAIQELILPHPWKKIRKIQRKPNNSPGCFTAVAYCLCLINYTQPRNQDFVKGALKFFSLKSVSFGRLAERTGAIQKHHSCSEAMGQFL